MEKRQRQYDKAVEEWKNRVSEQQTETERWQKECRSQANETYKVKAQVDEAQQAVDALRKDNKNLNGISTIQVENSYITTKTLIPYFSVSISSRDLYQKKLVLSSSQS